MKNTRSIPQIAEALAPTFEALSHRVWHTPETCYAEHASAAAHAEELERQGFAVTRGLAGIPTAVMGEAGQGGPVIAILGEYDALPALSQEAGAAERRPLAEGGAGHGCGHNLLGAGSMLAATAVKQWLEEQGLEGRVRYYGCPAEEGGAAKAFMVRAGLFDDVDAAFCWHPENFCEVISTGSLANIRVDFRFTGTSSHAAVAPHLGRSALDAVELMSVGANYLREHMTPDCRLHYAYLDAGGIAPNVVQGAAAVRYAVRAGDVAGMRDLYERVCDVARGAALMTGTRVEITPISAVSDMLLNAPMQTLMWEELEAMGPPAFDEEDRAFAAHMQTALSERDIADAFRRFGLKPVPGQALCEAVVPREAKRLLMLGSTDVADVSRVVPLAQVHGATSAIGTPFHTWQLVAQGLSPMANKGMVHAGTVIARSAARLIAEPETLAACRAAHEAAVAEDPYVSPLPEGTEPPIREMAGA